MTPFLQNSLLFHCTLSVSSSSVHLCMLGVFQSRYQLQSLCSNQQTSQLQGNQLISNANSVTDMKLLQHGPLFRRKRRLASLLAKVNG